MINIKSGKFILQREELPSNLLLHLYTIEKLTALKFKFAEDWTRKNKGYVLHFENDILKSEQTWNQAFYIIHKEFAKNPESYTSIDDQSYLDELVEYPEGWRMFISNI